MNTNKLKKFASKSRELLLNEVRWQLKYLNTDKPDELPSYLKDWTQIDDVSFSEWKKKTQRSNLIDRINDVWEDVVIEEIAYLWFNRFIALRYMEVNNYLSFWSRVLSSDDKDKWEPDIISNALHLIGLKLDKQIIYGFQDSNNKDWLFKYLIINICNSLHDELPFMFEKISDYTELLFPDSLLEKWSFLGLLVNEVDEDDFKEVEVLWWLYQFYISDKKDILINAKKKYKKNDIPAVTQLFTSKWIVQYMVENTIWKTWLESHPNKELQSKWKYYIESESTWEINQHLKPEDITVLDPAMWSWHILVYAFEVLYEIYKSAWYVENDIPKLIIKNNLYWLEIDDRAWQIACFAIMMKARQYNKKILHGKLELNICSIQEVSTFNDIDELIYPELSKLCISFNQWKLIWSLISLNHIDLNTVNKEYEKFKKEWSINYKLINLMQLIISQAYLIDRKYSCVVSNPPYMGWKYMSNELGNYVKKNFPDTKSDLFSAFMERNFKFTKINWMLWFMTPFVWMFIQSYQKLRENIIDTKTISSLIQLEYNAFENACIPICTFTIRNYKSDVEWDYIKLSDFKWSESQPVKTLEAIKNPDVNYKYKFNTNNFSAIPWSPIAYWVSDKIREIFSLNKKLWDLSPVRIWLKTWDNDRFLRYWSEVNYGKIWFNIKSREESKIKWLKWFPYNKWWENRRWYWNRDFIVNWQYDWKEITDWCNYLNTINTPWGVTVNKEFYFKEKIEFSRISSSKFSTRYVEHWSIFDTASVWVFHENLLYILAYLNSKVNYLFVSLIAPTLTFQSWDVSKTAIIFPNWDNIKKLVEKMSKDNITIARNEWNSREVSSDFKENELIIHNMDNNLEKSYSSYCIYWNNEFMAHYKNEEELNRLFIEIYWLEDEMTPEVELKEITLLKNEKKIIDWKLIFQKEEIIKQFISYAVGCMMWRYSLDKDGLVFAWWEFDNSNYTSFLADDDGIIPVLSDEYFEDDIVARFREFVKTCFWDDNLNTNLDFIASALAKKASETSLDRIRRYFVNEFYKDHVKRYKKRPIYWMFTSWKDKTFNTLVYLHRYDKSIIWKIRMDYLHKLQWNFEWTRSNIASKMIWATWKDKIDLEKSQKVVMWKIDNLKHYDEKLRHMADQKIELDLDDWVKVNYPKFWDLLETIKL